MRTTLLAAFAVLTLMTVAARAESEGNGDPFPFRTVGTVTATGPAASAIAAASPRIAFPSQPHDQTADSVPLRTSRHHT